jgi:GalNAc-alpha-(1->4)-GalNAc-alpha-(1->3)-diNAcBac-PP-undecaprenol alpha-1,4-N-acetyl-D-galactosaminyltransferase
VSLGRSSDERPVSTPAATPVVALVISILQPGGAERVMTTIANHWAAEGRRVWLVTFGSPDDGAFFPLDSLVRRVDLDVLKARRNPFKGANSVRQVLTLRRALKQIGPDVVISFIVETNVLTLMATRGMGVPVVVSDRLDPHVHRLTTGWRILRRVLYPRATGLVAQTQAALSFFPETVRRRGRVIPNPVISAPAPPAPAEVDAGKRRLVALGRLDRQKGFDLLLAAFARVQAQHEEWALEIWGEGPERRSLELMVESLGLRDKAILPGLTSTPSEVLRAADLFVMSSRFEGFPNALCEAMASGVAVVSFDCPSGPSDIIRNGIDGILVPPENVGELARVLDRLMSSDNDREALAARAPEITERYSVARVMSQWDRLVEDSLRKAPPAR